MRSCIFQLRRHQTHSTFPLSQAEFALYFYPLAFVLVILNLVPFLTFLGPSQSRAGQPDTPLFAVAEIFAVCLENFQIPYDVVRDRYEAFSRTVDREKCRLL